MVDLSIIIPLYNSEKYISKLLDSVIKQINERCEIIIVNDESTDNSKKVCEEYIRNNQNIQLIDIKNSGSGIARNVGIMHSRGKYLFFPDADDEIIDGAIKRILEDIKSNDDLYVYGFNEMRRDNTLVSEYMLSDSVIRGLDARHNYIEHMLYTDKYIQGAPWNKVFKKQIIDDNDIKYSSLRRHQDELFIYNYVTYVNNIHFSSFKIYNYFINNSLVESFKFPKNYFEIRKELYTKTYDIVSKWQGNDLNILFITLDFLLSTKRCFYLIFSEKWGLDKKQRKDYVKNVLNDQKILESGEIIKKKYNDVFECYQNYISKKKILFYKFYVKSILKKRVNILYLIGFISYKMKAK